MLKNLLLIAALTASLNAFASGHSVKDSTGIEKKAGKSYVIHKVDAKETLYSIAKKYGVTINEIKNANDNISSDLKLGQTLLVPVKNISNERVAAKTHTVVAKETLYSISKKYGVTIDDIKKANPDVKIDQLKEGDVIAVSKNAIQPTAPSQSPDLKYKTHTVVAKETLYSISKKYQLSVEELKKANPGIAELSVGQVLNLSTSAPVSNVEVKKSETAVLLPEVKKEIIVPVKIAETKAVTEEKKPEEKVAPIPQPVFTVKPGNNLPAANSDGYTKVNEEGMVEMYDPASEFHYALHKTAPVGVIVFIENSDSGQRVYVRVMGRLTGGDPGVIMKVSKKAFDKISKGESKVKVTTSYIP